MTTSFKINKAQNLALTTLLSAFNITEGFEIKPTKFTCDDDVKAQLISAANALMNLNRRALSVIVEKLEGVYVAKTRATNSVASETPVVAVEAVAEAIVEPVEESVALNIEESVEITESVSEEVIESVVSAPQTTWTKPIVAATTKRGWSSDSNYAATTIAAYRNEQPLPVAQEFDFDL